MLAGHEAVQGVRYPGLPQHPQAALVRAQMQDFGTIVTFELRDGPEAGRRFAEALEFFTMTASLGSTESLVLPPQMLQPRDFSPEQRAQCGITAGTVRLSIGLEDIEDLRADLLHALAAAQGT